MRELTKSMASFTWSLSLFGLQQLGNLLAQPDPNRPRGKTAEAFDDVTRAAEEQLGDMLQQTFKAGDKFQRGMVDMVFGLFGGQALNPGAWMRGMAGGMAGMGGCGSCRPDEPRRPDTGEGPWQDEATGWGPMPPADSV